MPKATHMPSTLKNIVLLFIQKESNGAYTTYITTKRREQYTEDFEEIPKSQKKLSETALS